tara:strand:- start:328 stop:570 length:243 start_codon:yes stop_codon:yes gene_type:complete
MSQPNIVPGYGGTDDLDVGLAEIEASLSELLPRLDTGQSEQSMPELGAMEPTPLADARLKAVKTQLSRFPGQEVPEEEMI